jgi:hypothetical protein
MGRVPITILGYKCDHCGHEWLPVCEGEPEPKFCPECKNPDWNIPPIKEAMKYSEFCLKVKAVLSSGERKTWTEIRTIAKLPQKWPNNQWVRCMENDIHLVREKDQNGIINWRIIP